MKQFINYPEGGKVEITENGVKITSETGEILEIGSDGRLKNRPVKNEPYWFKYFFLMGEAEREAVKKWYKKTEGETELQKKFLEIVGEAIKNVNYDYRIATMEPSEGKNGEIFYEKGKDVYRGLNCYEWEEKAKEYAPKYGSELANLYELFLWYAYRIAKGYWHLTFICYDYFSNRMNNVKPAGEEKLGGFFDGPLNTWKIVKDPSGGFCLCGGIHFCIGSYCSIAGAQHPYYPSNARNFSTGWLVLKK